MKQKKERKRRMMRPLALAMCAVMLTLTVTAAVLIDDTASMDVQAARTYAGLEPDAAAALGMSEQMTTAPETEVPSSQPEPTEGGSQAETTAQAETTTEAGSAPEQADPYADMEPFEAWINRTFDWFWRTFSFLGFLLNPREGLVYNRKDPFQRIFGFNSVYETMQPVAFVFADTINCKFRYENKDWMIQLWKGAYAICICTGGEIGIYNKPTSRKAEHYDCARQADWIGMEMTIFNEDRRLFTRPFDKYWWITGYKFSYLDGFLSAPRDDCKMQAKLQLKDAEMASLMAQSLRKLGFAEVDKLNGVLTPDCFTLEGDTINLVWHLVMQKNQQPVTINTNIDTIEDYWLEEPEAA